MTSPTPSPLPNADQRAAFNAAQLHTGAETGFWDDHGRPAPWPDDIDQWQPATGEPINHQPGQSPF
ncbi:hypothetical protein [Cryptosporangium sp. NPDC051539]|uniref:hypothetical protein n=1 Tax=Cryptosporangium sp. NPDC051539 TaxID=3363962 RepID=UPI003797ED30